MSMLFPDWPAPANVLAAVTTRQLDGVSTGAYAGFNLATHVGDDALQVQYNRALLRTLLSLPAEPAWLNQVHGTAVMDIAVMDVAVTDTAAEKNRAAPPDADASYSAEPGPVCVVMTADCLPVLFCSDNGQEVAAAHAGWKGLLDGVLEATVARFHAPPSQLLAWLGPAIGPSAFEVGPEVREAFVTRDAETARAFQPGTGDRWLADIYLLARLRLARCGVARVYGGGLCTVTNSQRFYSYRREGVTGRMASLVWRVA